MPIAALPPTTVRAIGSTSVISDPCSVVKELLENALDASASSVAIEISQNTLDVIQVKDNGHGILPEDHTLVCRRTFTSKIQTVEDLKNINGSSYGFRGQALASAVEMSGGLTVTTRSENQVVGSTLQYGRNGELVSSKHASHPVGTTVRVTDFLKYIPVRRQTALKDTSKTLTKIKKMLQAYAISQPTKKLSLKVLKAKNESGCWMYVPGKDATLTDAALKVVGSEVTSCCILESRIPEQQGSDSGRRNREGNSGEYELVALLPRADIDFSRVSNAGQFLAVDGRPISTTRGTGNDVVKLYKSYIRSAASRSGYSTKLSDPFICLQIRCPQGSYDVNVEPAKDDILFENPQLLLSFVEDLFRDSYGVLENPAGKGDEPVRTEKQQRSNNGFNLLMARKRPVESSCLENGNPSFKPLTASVPHSKFRSPLPESTPRRGDYEHHNLDTEEVTYCENDTGFKNLEGLNPWSMTAMNVPLRTPERSQGSPGKSRRLAMFNSTGQGSRPRKNHSRQSHGSPTLPSPSDTNPSSASPTQHNDPPSPAEYSQASITRQRQNLPESVSGKAEREKRSGILDNWLRSVDVPAGLQSPVEGQPEYEQEGPPLSQLAHERFGFQKHSIPNTPASTVLESSPPCESSQNVPQTQSTSLSEEDLNANIHRHQELPGPKKLSTIMHQFPEENDSLEKALDFERRKKEVVQKQRESTKNPRLRVSEGDQPPSSSPHHSRYIAAKAALNSDSSDSARDHNLMTSGSNLSAPALNAYDPRAYLMRNRKELSNEGPKIRRIYTSKLPFERIPEGQDLCNIAVTQPADMGLLSVAFKKALNTDLYTQRGMDDRAFSKPVSEELRESWTHQLAALMGHKYGLPNEEVRTEIDISSAISRHLDHYLEELIYK